MQIKSERTELVGDVKRIKCIIECSVDEYCHKQALTHAHLIGDLSDHQRFTQSCLWYLCQLPCNYKHFRYDKNSLFQASNGRRAG